MPPNPQRTLNHHLDRQHLAVTGPGDLGDLVRAVRIQAGLTQADAAALCGVSVPFMNGLERGKPTAQLGLALAVCASLGIDLTAAPAEPIGPVSEAPKRKPRSS